MKYSLLFFFFTLCISCTKIKPRKPINPKPSSSIYFDAMKQNKVLNELENKKILQSIASDSTNVYLQSKNGFWYTYVNKVEEDLNTPRKGDEVVLSYNITDLNDVVIYSKEDLDIKNYVVDEEDFISGLQKGIKLMKLGETITFVIPSYSAFGIIGDKNKIGINQSIKSTVTLINIK